MNDKSYLQTIFVVEEEDLRLMDEMKRKKEFNRLDCERIFFYLKI